MRLRSGIRFHTISKPMRTKRPFLTTNMFRRNGDAEAHKCVVCLQKLKIQNCIPNWKQCPNCKDVLHDKCFQSLQLKTCDDVPRCGYCRHELPTIDDDDDTWEYRGAMDCTLIEEEEKNGEESSSEEESEESASEESASEESDFESDSESDFESDKSEEEN